MRLMLEGAVSFVLNRKILIIAGAAILSCIVAMGVWAYVRANSGYSVYIYYFNIRTNQLESEERVISVNDPALMVETVLRMLYVTPRNNALRQTIPEGLFLDSVNISLGGVMTASFPVEYHDMPSYEEALFRASFVQTMTNLPFINIEGVRILVDGEELFDSFGEPLGIHTQSSVLVNPNIRARRVTSRTLTLYFVNEDLSGLVSEERHVDVAVDAVEYSILNQLIEGPQIDDGRMSGIPAGTRIMGILTEPGICSINLSEEFVSNFSGSPTAADLTLQAIVNTIFENQSTINSIQFLIESERRESFNGVPDFDAMFVREEPEQNGE